MSGLAAAGPLAAARASRRVEIAFCFPAPVGGTVAALAARLVEDFARERPQIGVTLSHPGTYPEALATCRAGHERGTPRRTWGLPFQRSTLLLYWNRQHFRESGLDPDRPPGHWQEMQGFATRLTRREPGGLVTRWGLQIPSSEFAYWPFQGLAAANGVLLANPGGTRTRFDQRPAVEALQFWIDLARQHKVHPPDVVSWASTLREFRAGTVSMIWAGSRQLGAFQSNPGLDFGVARLPERLRRGSPTGGGDLYLLRRRPAAERAAALELARWLATPERSAQWALDSGSLPVREAAWETPRMKRQLAEFPAGAAARDQLADAVAELSTHDNQRVTRALNGAIVAALEGHKAAGPALDDAQRDAERILSPYQR